MLVGYARVSTIDRNLTLQCDALTGAGCGTIFVEQMSGAVSDRPELICARLHARWRHACCVEARPLGAFDEAAHRDCRRAAGQRHQISESDRGARYDDSACCFSHIRRARGVRARLDPRAHPGRACRSASGLGALAVGRRSLWTTTWSPHGRCSRTPTLPLPRSRSVLACRPQRCIDICSPRAPRMRVNDLIKDGNS